MSILKWEAFEEEKLEEYSVKTRVKHKMDVFEHLQRIWSKGEKVRVGVICSKDSCAMADVLCGLKLNDFLDSHSFYSIDQIETSLTNKRLLMAGLKKAERGDYDVVIISRGGTSKEKGYGILDDDDVKTFVANMTKLTICAIGHVKDSRSDNSFYEVYDFDAKTPSLAFDFPRPLLAKRGSTSPCIPFDLWSTSVMTRQSKSKFSSVLAVRVSLD